MITLIIFLLIILIAICIIAIFLKVKIDFNLKIKNFNLEYEIKTKLKTYSGRYILEKKNNALEDKKKNNALGDKKKNNVLKNKKKNNVCNNFKKYKQDSKTNNKNKIKEQINDFTKLIEVNNLNIKISAGALFITPTIILVQIFNILIPLFFNLPFKKKKNLSFSALPVYDKLAFNAEIKGEIKIALYLLIILFIMYKKNKKNLV